MSRKKKVVGIALLMLLMIAIAYLICSCSKSPPVESGRNASTIASRTAQEVGVVRISSAGMRGAPILIFEEVHNSRQAQLQLAIALVRLYEQYQLRDIVLEGFLREEPPITTDWWTNLVSGSSQKAKARIAVRLLKEGEISSSEFMKLVYHDVQVHPAETAEDYPKVPDAVSASAPIVYLFRIASRSVRQEAIPKANQLMDDVEQLMKKNDMAEAAIKQKELMDYVLSFDPWCQAKARFFQDNDVILSSEQQMAAVDEIVERAKKLGVELAPAERAGMDQFLTFLRLRIRATTTMASSVEKISDQPNISAVALVIGAAHTEHTSKTLKNDKRSYAVVTPLSLSNRDKRGDIPWEMFERKYHKLSIYSEGFTKSLLGALSTSGSIKPKNVLSMPWFQGKAELYLFTDYITRAILGPPSPPHGGPPYGFNEDDFKGNWVYVDPNRISIVSDKKKGEGRAVLFLAVLNYADKSKRTEMWVKAALGTATVEQEERESVEAMLKNALEGVISEAKCGTSVEDEAGRVQFALNRIAAFGLNMQTVSKVNLGGI